MIRLLAALFWKPDWSGSPTLVWTSGALKKPKGGSGVKSDPTGTHHSRPSTFFTRMLVCRRLLASGAGIHVDFHANRHFDDLRCFPGHFGSPKRETGRTPPYPQSKYRSESSPAESFGAGFGHAKYCIAQ